MKQAVSFSHTMNSMPFMATTFSVLCYKSTPRGDLSISSPIEWQSHEMSINAVILLVFNTQREREKGNDPIVSIK